MTEASLTVCWYSTSDECISTGKCHTMLDAGLFDVVIEFATLDRASSQKGTNT